MKRIPTVWNDAYHCPQASDLLSTRKQKVVVEAARAEALLEEIPDSAFDAAATWDAIAKVHVSYYVDAVRTGNPLDLAQSQGFGWSPEFAEATVRIWSGHVAACRLAMARSLAFHPASGAHHAREKSGSGFCTFNYLVGAGKQLLDEKVIERVLVLDLDTHQGNGTFELSASDDRFSLFDVGGASFGVSPREKGRVFIRLVKNEKEYFDALEKQPAFLDAHRPSLIQYQAGMDCHESDPLGGVKGMNAERLAERDGFVFALAKARGIPIVFNLAGGYQEDGTTVRLHVETVRVAAKVFSPSP